MTNSKGKKEPLFHIAKRSDIPQWKAWIIRIIAGIVGLFISAVFVTLFSKDFSGFFTELVNGTFGTERRIWLLFQNTAVLLGIALAVTPAFKMKFWNIGAEGQTLVGCLASAACVFYLGGKMPEWALIILMLGASMVASVIWSLIPAVFKALFNTNETLFTLMMNYVAMYLVTFFISIWVTSGSGVLGLLANGHLPPIANQQYLLNILIVVAMTIVLFFYLRFSKHGYELSVVGESINTAKYIGINVKKVIVRTMLFSGLMCGIMGWILVAGTNFTVYSNIVGGRGFTAILVSWLAHFNPIGMIVTAFLVVFLQQGATQVNTVYRLGPDAFEAVVVGIFLLFIIGCEFFINYRIKFSGKIGKKAKRKADTNIEGGK